MKNQTDQDLFEVEVVTPYLEKIDRSNFVLELELKYKTKKPFVERTQVITPELCAVFLLANCFDMNTIALNEEFIILLLNNSKDVIGWSRISQGGSTSTIVEPSKVMATAILGGANCIILAHNHPSGYLKESKADIMLTKRLADTGRQLGIPVIDHIIVTPDKGFMSMKSKNLL